MADSSLLFFGQWGAQTIINNFSLKSFLREGKIVAVTLVPAGSFVELFPLKMTFDIAGVLVSAYYHPYIPMVPKLGGGATQGGRETQRGGCEMLSKN